MVGVLEIIFGLDPVAGELGVTRQRLVFLKQLGGVAALAIVLPVAGVSGHALGALPTAAATPAALTIVDQNLLSLSLVPASPVTVLSSLPKESVGPVAVGRPAPEAQVDPPFAVSRIIVSECAAMSSGVGGGSASFS